MIYLDNDSTYSQRVFIPRDEPTTASTTGHTIVLQDKDYQISQNGTTRIHPDAGYDGISGGTIGVYVSAATGVTFENINIEENGLYVPTGDSVYTGVTVNVDQEGPYNSGYTEGYSEGYTSGNTDGYASGSTDGYASGYTEGYASGNTDGYASGRTDGIDYQKSLLSSVTIKSNGTTTYPNGVSAVTVDTPTGSTINNQSKTINLSTADTYTTKTQGIIVTPDAGYTGLDDVTIKTDFRVHNAINAGKFTTNGNYVLNAEIVGFPGDVFNQYQFEIDVESTGGTGNLTSETFTENKTFLPPEGYDGWSAVTVNVDTTEAYNNGYRDGYQIGYEDGYKEGQGDVTDEYFTISILSAGSITLDFTDYPVEIAINNGSFYSTTGGTFSAQAGDKIRIKGNNTTYGDSAHVYSDSTEIEWEVKGNSMSLFYGDNFSAQTEFPTTSTTMGHFFHNPNRNNDEGLKSAKHLVLPANRLNEGCYAYMFAFCRSLADAPELPGMVMAPWAYANMFQACNLLTEMPLLLATKLEEYCYYNMFQSAGITRVKTLPATILAPSCYESMFSSCPLAFTPSLPAMTIPDRAYNAMFYACYNLTEAPEFPYISQIGQEGMAAMFRGCRSLTDIPSINAGVIGNYGLANMFAGCNSLTSGSTINAQTIGSYGCSGMYQGCSLLTTSGAINATTIGDYCFDSMFQSTGIYTSPSLPNAPLSEGCYRWMFSHCINTFTPPALTATTLEPYCYEGMFYGTDVDTYGFTLPATTLKRGCYRDMFGEAGALMFTAPTLPAQTLVPECYEGMFFNCSNLTSITCLATNISATDATKGWVNGVSSSGTFTKASGVIWPTGDDGIPNNWTVQDA